MAQDPKLHKLDDLFRDAKQYSNSDEFKRLILFCKRMRHLGPYNAMLASIQMPGARFLLSAKKWWEHGRAIKYSARPIMILLPFSPVDFVFDLSDTVPVDQHIFVHSEDEIIEHIMNKYNPVLQYDIRKLRETLEHNLNIEGIAVEYVKMGTESAGEIRTINSRVKYEVEIPINKREKWSEKAQAYYFIQISQDLSEIGRFLTMLHELGHLYCHHLPHPNPSAEEAWANRRLNPVIKEFEAESVADLVFDHFGFSTSGVSGEYLANYLNSHDSIPADVSPEAIFSAAGKIISLLEHKMNYRDGLVFKNNKEFSSRIEKMKAKTKKAKEKKSKAEASRLQALPFQES